MSAINAVRPAASRDRRRPGAGALSAMPEWLGTFVPVGLMGLLIAAFDFSGAAQDEFDASEAFAGVRGDVEEIDAAADDILIAVEAREAVAGQQEGQEHDNAKERPAQIWMNIGFFLDAEQASPGFWVRRDGSHYSSSYIIAWYTRFLYISSMGLAMNGWY